MSDKAEEAVARLKNELARCKRELDEASAAQSATGEILQIINDSRGAVDPVFDRLLDRAMQLCEAAFGILVIAEGDTARAVSSRNVPSAFVEFLMREPLRLDPNTFLAQALTRRQIIHVADSATAEPYRNGAPLAVAAVDLGGIRTMLMVPMMKEDNSLGLFTIYRQEVRPFSEAQITLLQSFAAQAVVTMENARLLGELRARNEEIAAWNRELEARVGAQLSELERARKLRRFLPPQLAELILAKDDDSILQTHRREIVVVFCDLRGFTGFAERGEPEDVIDLLRSYHGALGPIIERFEGTLDHYAGDGIMVFFNDPVPCPDPAKRAVEMAIAMRQEAQASLKQWRRHGHRIGFGVGIAQGYATLGEIGYAERRDYTAIGTVTNLAGRLCAEAKDGQILISSRVASRLEGRVDLEEIGDLSLKGLSQAVIVYNVIWR